jgi:hypothetical protein
MEVKTFGAYGSSGQAAITNFSSGNPAQGYIKLTPSTFTAPPDQWSYVQASISIPKTASLGYYYALVFQPALPSGIPHPGHAVINGSNAILILINTNSANESKQLGIAKFSVNKKLFEYLPANFSITVHNPGNIFLAPVGDIYISKNSNGSNTIDTLPINAGAGNVLPGTNRAFTATWSDGFPVFVAEDKDGQPVLSKSGNPVEQLKWKFADANKFRFGEYYARLALAYNNGTREVLLNSTVSFWVIPWKLLLVALLILLIILAALFIIIRSIWRKIRAHKKPKITNNSLDQSS